MYTSTQKCEPQFIPFFVMYNYIINEYMIYSSISIHKNILVDKYLKKKLILLHFVFYIFNENLFNKCGCTVRKYLSK